MESKEIKIVTPEFQKTIQDLIDKLQADQFPDAEEYRFAQKFNVLPIGVDLWSYVFLTSKGEIIDQDYDGNFQHHEFNLQDLIRVIVVGKRRYPQLEKFIPNPSADAKTCPVCEGTKIWKNAKDVVTGNPVTCVICAGLGWVTVEYWKQFIETQKELKIAND